MYSSNSFLKRIWAIALILALSGRVSPLDIFVLISTLSPEVRWH
ncbi:unnamed protein product [Acidithrix sp. C25]|nr:unnamed protein product [Acidithrix sp. C25]